MNFDKKNNCLHETEKREIKIKLTTCTTLWLILEEKKTDKQ